MITKSINIKGFAIAGLFFALHTPLFSAIPTRDQNPMLQMFLLPGFVLPAAENQSRFQSQLQITNTYHEETSNSESLVIDIENTRLDLRFSHTFINWQISTNIPIYGNRSGNLDGLIEDWHGFFNLPQGGRTQNPDDQLQIEYIKDNESIFLFNKPGEGIGDIELSLSKIIKEPDQQITTLTLSVELPTGALDDNTGNESVDSALSVAWFIPLNSQWSSNTLLGIAFPSAKGPLTNVLRPEIWVAQLSLTYDFQPGLSGLIQFDAHSRFLKNSDLKPFSNSLQMQLGLQLEDKSKSNKLDLYFSEDIFVGSAPDITFGMGYSNIF
ncbi:MAG: hypothetical protein ACI845_003554 [Gammaproteobacteria bacterium]